MTKGVLLALGVGLLGTLTGALTGRGLAETKALTGDHHEWVLIDEKTSSALIEEPEHHFRLARQAFLHNDMKTAARELRTTVVFLKLEATRATDAGGAALSSSAAEIERLADALDAGNVPSLVTLDNAMIAAHRALANHHVLKATACLLAKECSSVAHDLEAASTHLDHALGWVKQETDVEARRIAEEGHSLAARLRKGADITADEVGNTLQRLGREIQRLGEKVEPAEH